MANPMLLEILLADNEISSDQLKKSLTLHRKSNKPVGLILIEEGYISEATLTRYLAKEYETLSMVNSN